jgi:hypothetical protein
MAIAANEAASDAYTPPVTIKERLIMLTLGLSLVSSACGNESVATNTATSAPPAAPATASSAPQTVKEPAPDAVIAELYDQHTRDQGPFFQTEHRDRVDHFFVKDLADLIWNDAVESKGEVGALEFDPLYNAQDTDIKNLEIAPAVIEGTMARVPVTFENFGAKTEILYSLEQQGTTWKISDIRWDKEMTLRELLRPEAGSP